MSDVVSLETEPLKYYVKVRDRRSGINGDLLRFRPHYPAHVEPIHELGQREALQDGHVNDGSQQR